MRIHIVSPVVKSHHLEDCVERLRKGIEVGKPKVNHFNVPEVFFFWSYSKVPTESAKFTFNTSIKTISCRKVGCSSQLIGQYVAFTGADNVLHLPYQAP